MNAVICLFLRSDVDWSRLSEETYLEQATSNRSVICISEKKRRELLQCIQIWNRTFSMNYFAYRQELKAIGDANRSRLRNLDLVIRNRHQWPVLMSLAPAVVVPVDEDDWFCPDLPDLLREQALREQAGRPVDLFTWHDAVFCPVRGHAPKPGRRQSLVFRQPTENGVWTNAYAVTGHGLLRCPPECRDDLLNRHGKVLSTFQEHVPEFQTAHLPGVLSITHKSPASFTKLLTIDSEHDLLAQIPHLEQPTQEIPVPVAWAADAIRQVDDLNRALVRSLRPRWSRLRIARPQPLPQDTPLTRTCVINQIIAHWGYASYLEIGCGNNEHFAAISAPSKVGVDPRSGGTFRMTSDEFFQLNQAKFDLVFVDGLHLEEQVLRDVENALRVLRPEGCVLIHDCLPVEEVHQERVRRTASWFGDVWKAVVRLRTRSDLDIAVLGRCCGMGAVFQRPNTDRLIDLPALNWTTYVQHKHRLLRVLDVKAFNRFLTSGSSASMPVPT